MIDLAAELSVIVARDDDGDVVSWPVAENLHRDGILDVSIAAGARRPRRSPTKRATTATAIAAALDYVGVLCVELFVARGRQAARQRDRAAAAQQRPLHDRRLRDVAVRAAGAHPGGAAAGRHAQHTPAVMLNLLGDLWFDSGGRRRRASPTGRACSRTRAPAASVRQARAAPRPQDGPRHVPRRDARRRARHGRRDQARPRHPRRRRVSDASAAGRRATARRRARARPDAAAAGPDVHAVPRRPRRRRRQGRGHRRGRLRARRSRQPPVATRIGHRVVRAINRNKRSRRHRSQVRRRARGVHGARKRRRRDRRRLPAGRRRGTRASTTKPCAPSIRRSSTARSRATARPVRAPQRCRTRHQLPRLRRARSTARASAAARRRLANLQIADLLGGAASAAIGILAALFGAHAQRPRTLRRRRDGGRRRSRTRSSCSARSRTTARSRRAARTS